MWDTTRTRGAWIGLMMGLAIFIVNGAITAMNLWRIRVNANLVERSHDLMSEIKLLRIRMIDAETGMRGYVIAEKSEFLQPYEKARAAVDPTLLRLTELTHENPDQEKLQEVLNQQVASSLAHIQQCVALQREGRHDQSVQTIGTGEGKDRMDAIRKTLQQMEESELQVLDVRDSDSRTAYQIALVSGILTSLFGMVPSAWPA